MPRLHILTQYLWPDDAPTGIYAEQLADAVAARGIEVALIAGSGTYRAGRRPAPATAIRRIEHATGKRGRLFSTAIEHRAVKVAFARYLRGEVRGGDVVVLTSAPAETVFLHGAVRGLGATGVYWLQDYYPQLLRGAFHIPSLGVRAVSAFWNRALSGWDHVVKSAANLGYHGSNARVIRNWNTLEPGPARPAVPRTALYSGNLGYAHDLDAFLARCRELHEQGYSVTVRGDGPGMQRLPAWVHAEPPYEDPAQLVASYWAAEIHLVAADPGLPEAIFPSKLWNSLAVERPVSATGFAGPMAAELEVALKSDFRRHLPQWVDFLAGLFG